MHNSESVLENDTQKKSEIWYKRITYSRLDDKNQGK